VSFKKVLCTVLLIATFCGILSGCYDKKEIDDLTFVVAMGIDKGKVNAIKMTVQYAIPAAMGGMGGGGGGGDTSKSIGLATVEAPSIYSGLNMINNFIGKQISMSHAIVAVFSEEIAKSGKLHGYLLAMARGREFRPNMYIAVSRSSAEDYLKSIKPIQEVNPAKYYELKFATYKYTGFTANTQFGRFFDYQESTAIQPVATLVGVGTYESSKDIDAAKSTYIEKGRKKPLMGDYKAGDVPKTGDIKGETMGLAVFEGPKMAGELDGQEATMYLIASGQYKSSYVTFQDPHEEDSYVILNLKQSRVPKYNIDLSNGKPNISLKLKLEADFLSIQSGINYEDDGLRKEFEQSASLFMKNEITRLLNRTAKEFHSDICGFGRFAKGKFLTWNQWISYDWLKKYKDATFNVDVDLKIRRPGLLIRSQPSASQ
jgi:spore germination protein KC